MNAKFKYEDKELTIQFNRDETAQEVCNHFVNKTFLDFNELHFKYDNRLLNMEIPLIAQLELPEETNEIEITVVKKDKDNEHYVNVSINGIEKKLVVQKGKGIFESVSHFLKKRTKTLLLLYNGQVLDATDKKKTFHEVANKTSKEQNSMNVIALDKEETNEEQRLIRETTLLEGNEDEIKKTTGEKEEDKINILDDEKEGKDEKYKEEIKEKKDYEEEDDSMKSRYFFIKFYLILLIQYIFIGLLSFLGFYTGFDEIFSSSTAAFWITLVINSLFAFFFSFISVGLEAVKNNKFKYFMLIIYVPIIVLFIFLLKTHKSVDIVEGKYFIYQIIIFAFDFLICILYNLIFPFYRGWLNAIFLVAINLLAMIIYCFPISETYKDLKVSNNGLVGLSIISTLMIVFLMIFNFEILDKEKFEPLNFAIIFSYIPINIALCVVIMVGCFICQIISFILIFLGFAIYVIVMFLVGLFGRN